MYSGVTTNWLLCPSSACTRQNRSRLPGDPFLWIWISDTRIRRSGSEQFPVPGAEPSGTPDEYMDMPSLSNEARGVGLAGTAAKEKAEHVTGSHCIVSAKRRTRPRKARSFEHVGPPRIKPRGGRLHRVSS
jgi:hypothetical protein